MKTGVIGLGAMGGPMALNLQRAGHLAAVWNRTRAKAEAIAAETGCALAADPAELARHCEFVITCVSADEDLLAVIDALLPGLEAGKIVGDTSTVSADTAREAARRLQPGGAAFIDLPVSGGVEGARKGTLAMMAGGSAEVVDRARPVLAALAARVVHMGPVGSGQATKAVNQIMVAGIVQGISEALAFGQAQGLDMDKVIEVIGGGAAASWLLQHRGPTMVRGEYDVGFKVALHLKDLRICQEMAAAKGATLETVAATMEQYRSLIEQGHGDEDISSLHRLKRAQFR